MIRLNYSQSAVLTMFFQGGGDLNPSTAQLQEFDQDLFDADEQILVDEMTRSQLDSTDVAAKSTILMYSRITGGGSIAAQIHRACTFFKNTRNL